MRTRLTLPYHENWAPHIWPSFGQMWELTDLERKCFRRNWHPHLAKRRPDMGHPVFVVRNVLHLVLKRKSCCLRIRGKHLDRIQRQAGEVGSCHLQRLGQDVMGYGHDVASALVGLKDVENLAHTRPQ